MDIHHAMIIHSAPEKVYTALTQQRDLEIWMDAPAHARPEVGSLIEFQYDQGKRIFRLEITRLEAVKQVQWRVIQPAWPVVAGEQMVDWTLIPYETSTLVDLRMNGWPQDDDVYASVSYKWATFMQRLKIYMGDSREISSLVVEMSPTTFQQFTDKV